MKQAPQDKYSVAWLKLAECISRREKERALGVYRLLSHSFENPAAAYQLEGDILLAFSDQAGAIKMYEKAAQKYYEQEELLPATAVYENLFVLTGNQVYVDKIIALCAQLKQATQMFKYVQHLCVLMLRRQECEQGMQLLDRLQLSNLQKIDVVVGVAYRAVADHLMPGAMKIKVVHQALDAMVGDVQLLSNFFSEMKALDSHCYHEACAYVEGKKKTF